VAAAAGHALWRTRYELMQRDFQLVLPISLSAVAAGRHEEGIGALMALGAESHIGR
jgi:hypothetical protein